MAPAPMPSRAVWLLAACMVAFQALPIAKELPAKPESQSAAPALLLAPSVPTRGLRTFMPKPGDAIDDPSTQVVQLLMDRQDKGDFESYMIQILFRGKPSSRGVRVLSDRIEIDFYDTGKPSMRLAKIRGGAVEASAIEEFFYKDSPVKTGSKGTPHLKKMVRLTLFMHDKPELKFRDTLDRTLIHFRLAKPVPAGK